MRFLVDESLQRHVAKLHVDNGHNAVHVSDIGLRSAPDETVLAAADVDSRILITADTCSAAPPRSTHSRLTGERFAGAGRVAQ